MKALETISRAIARLFGRGRGLGADPNSAKARPVRREPPAGREQLLDRILSTIHSNSILLCGEPGIGKTSILLELRSRLAEVKGSTHEYFPVYIDLRGVPESLLFATVADAVLGQLDPLLGWNRSTGAEVLGVDYSHRDLAEDLRQVIRALRKRSPRRARLVLLVDGIDELNNYDPRTTQRVRSLFMASLAENLVMVASAVEIDKHWEQEGSPWYNFFEEIDLTDLYEPGRQRQKPPDYPG